MNIVTIAITPKDEIQTSKATGCPVFLVTDLLKNFQYIVTDKGTHFKIFRESGYAKIIVCRNADVVEVANQLAQLIGNDRVSSTSCRVKE